MIWEQEIIHSQKLMAIVEAGDINNFESTFRDTYSVNKVKRSFIQHILFAFTTDFHAELLLELLDCFKIQRRFALVTVLQFGMKETAL